MIALLQEAAKAAWEHGEKVDGRRKITITVDGNGLIVSGRFASPLVGYHTEVAVGWEHVSDSKPHGLACAIAMVADHLEMAARVQPRAIIAPRDREAIEGTPEKHRRSDTALRIVSGLALVFGAVLMTGWPS